MPIVQIEILKGRTVDQKRELVKKMTDVISETITCPKEAVIIMIRELEKENYGTAGVLKTDQ